MTTHHLPVLVLAAVSAIAALTACSSTVDGNITEDGGSGPQSTGSAGGDDATTHATGGDTSAAAGGDTGATTANGDTDMAGADTGPTDPGASGARPLDQLPPAIANNGTWKLTFNDEFDSVDDIALDANPASGKKWWNGNEQCCIGPGPDPRDPTQGGVNFPSPVNGSSVNPYSVANGVLDITLALKDQLWTSGILTSVDGNGNGFAQQYGYFEMRAKLPAGPGTWPAFWLLDQTGKTGGPGGGGEIDIIEQYGQFPTGMCTTLHDWKNAGGDGPHKCDTTPNDPSTGQPINWPDGFHTVAMLWTADMMTFYADDQVYVAYPPLGVFDVPYYILLDLGVGSGWPTDQTPDPSAFEIDYVRVWSQ